MLAERGMVESRTLAQRLIMAGQVRVTGQVVLKPSQSFDPEVLISLDAQPPFVSRGGEKLAGAIEAFGLNELEGVVCVDVGASTGGFTDCLLQHGAEKVYAIDVGYGILHWKLRNDSRVISMEKTNARYVTGFPEPINLVTVDASFISLKTLLPVIKSWLDSTGKILALIKPQFEVGRVEAAKGEGVIRDPNLHRRVLKNILSGARELGFYPTGLIKSPLMGPKGNTEFLVLWTMVDLGLQKDDDFIQVLFEQNKSSE